MPLLRRLLLLTLPNFALEVVVSAAAETQECPRDGADASGRPIRCGAHQGDQSPVSPSDGELRAERSHLLQAARGSIPWASNDQVNVTSQLLCGMLADARADMVQRRDAGFRGWEKPNGTVTIPVPYAVNFSKGRGLGIFVLVDVPRGTVVHVDLPSFYVRIPVYVDLPLEVQRVARACSQKVYDKFIRDWCSLGSWLQGGGDAAICEIDDGRYMNENNLDEEANVGTCHDDEHRTCAIRDIAAGEELLEDYAADGLLALQEGSVRMSSLGGSGRLEQELGYCSSAGPDEKAMATLWQVNRARWGEGFGGHMLKC
mmetsp:Transcript_81849/g.228024  ORF Transcript_81849/g.228024 Transcript_81849/m.228024 type:complete len:315 (-) Transcript_81849:41-985(-)